MEEDIFFNEINLIMNRDYFDSMDKILTCLIYQGFLINPLTCHSCEMSSCGECLLTWDKNKEAGALCPNSCRKSLFRGKNKAIRNMLEALKIECVRCSIELNYQDLVSHVKETCGKIEINCDNLGGSMKRIREELPNQILKG